MMLLMRSSESARMRLAVVRIGFSLDCRSTAIRVKFRMAGSSASSIETSITV